MADATERHKPSQISPVKSRGILRAGPLRFVTPGLSDAMATLMKETYPESMFTSRAAPRQNYTARWPTLVISTRQSSRISATICDPKTLRLVFVARIAIGCADTSDGGLSKTARHLDVRAVYSIGPQPFGQDALWTAISGRPG
jgi:hypothetical protein